MNALKKNLSACIFSSLSTLLVTLGASSAAQAGQLIDAQFIGLERFDTITLMFRANYRQNCLDLNVKADLYLLDKAGQPKFQTTCAANSMNSTTTPGLATCFFREPIAAGTPGSRVLLRLWSAKADCSGYADVRANIASGYQDHSIQGSATDSVYYLAQKQNRVIEVDRENYRLRMDRNGGATYEFYNKRARINGSPVLTNAIHANMGATLQVAFHNHVLGPKMIPDSCDSNQGYWNPTQAGFFCSFDPRKGISQQPDGPAPGRESGLNVLCDGKLDNKCTRANRLVEFTKFKMFNWDYGRSYPGPYNPLDQGYLSQLVTAHDSYVEYDVTFQRNGPMLKGPIEIPTFYFTNNYRRYHFEEPQTGEVKTVNIAERMTTADNYKLPDNATDIRWISFENTSGVEQDVFTIAWFYEKAFEEDVRQYGYGVSETGAYNGIKFTNQPIFEVKPQKTYRFKYVVFPYRHDEVIQSKFGRLTILETIRRMKVD